MAGREACRTPGLGDDDFPGFPADECPAVMPNLSKHHSSMANVLKEDPVIYDRLRERQTALGVGLARCVKVGFDNRGHALVRTVGLAAGDAESYETFRELFDPALARQLGRLPERQPTDLARSGGLSVARADGTGRYVRSCSARAFRSFRGLRFPPAMTLEERCEVERLCCKALGGRCGEYHPLVGSRSYEAKPGGMSEADQEVLRLKGALFETPDSTLQVCSGAARHWPQGRGIFASSDGSCVAWLNEQEHLRVMVTEDGDCLQLAFRKLVRRLDDIAEAAGQEIAGDKSAEHFPWAHSEKLGFLTSNPMNVGTALQVSVMATLPRLAALEAADLRSTPWCAWCARQSVQVRAAYDKTGTKLPDSYELSNSECLGVSEVQLVNLVVEAAGRLVAMERRLEQGLPIAEFLAAPAALAPSAAPAASFIADKLRATLAHGLKSGRLFEAMALTGGDGRSLEAAILAASGLKPGAGRFASIEEAMSASIVQGAVGPPPRRSVDGAESVATCTPEPSASSADMALLAEDRGLPAPKPADDDRELAGAIVVGAVESFAPGVVPDSCCTVKSASPEPCELGDGRPESGMTLLSVGTATVNAVCAEALVDTVLGSEVKKACYTPTADLEEQILRRLPAGPRLCVLGSTSFQSPHTEALVAAVAQRLGAALASRAVVLTGGMPGVQETFAKQLGDVPSLFNLLPAGCQSGYGVGQDLSCGSTLEDRIDVFGRLGQVYLSFEGGPGVAREARAAQARGALCLPLVSTGGASGGLFGYPAEALRRPEAASAEQWACLERSGADREVVASAVAAIVLRHLGLKDASASAPALSAEEIVAVRDKVAASLVSGVTDGRLEGILASQQATSVQDTRKEIAAALLSSVDDGRLECILASEKANVAAVTAPLAMPAQLDAELSAVRDKVAASLMSSVDDGRLESILADQQAPEKADLPRPAGISPGPDLDIADLRGRLFNTITDAVSSGTIDDHFAKALSAPKEEPPPELTTRGCGEASGLLTPEATARPQPAEPDAEATPCRQPEMEPAAGESQSSSQALALLRGPPPELTTSHHFSPSMRALEAVSRQDRRIGELRAFVFEAERRLAEREEGLARMEEKVAAAKTDLQHLDLDVQWHKRSLEGANDRSAQLSTSQRCLVDSFEEKQRKLMHATVDAEPLQTARSQLSTAASLSSNVQLGYASVI